MSKAENPGNGQTNQNFKIDIDQIYKDFIKEIDANRSLINISSSSNNSILNKTTSAKADSITGSLKIEDTPQESRFHCFLRLVGFPVVASDKTFYNPGFDNMTGQEGKESKVKIANTPLPGFNDISLARERYTTEIRAVWGKRPANITASCMALSSGYNTRKFISSLTNPAPFEFTQESQSYNIDYSSIVGKTKISLKKYIDGTGNPPDKNKLPDKRTHLIKPFIVDARIDFTCNPANRRVAVPFVNNKSNLLVDGMNYIKRPLLEKVIRERFGTENSKDQLSTAQANIQDIVKNIPIIQDQALITKMTSDINGLSDAAQFSKYLNIINAMCKLLKDSKDTIQAAQADYYWLPQPSTAGPEGGSTVAPVILSANLNATVQNQSISLVTSSDLDIVVATLNKASSTFNAQVAKLNAVPDLGKFAFDEFKLTFDQDTSQALGDQVTDNLDELSKNRKKKLEDANSALRTIEIIMGEWSGFGLCDIVAIMASLYLMPKESLAGFLDPDARGRAIDAIFLDPSINVTLEKAYTDFLIKMQECYNLMDYAFEQYKTTNNQRT